MDDEPRRLDVDARVRDALIPPDAVVDRLVARALGDREMLRERRSRMRVALVIAVSVVLVLVVTGWQRRRPGGQHAAASLLAITGERSMLVVESDDGHRWVVGPGLERSTGGSYVIVVPK